jgi:hypothetical protein
MIDTLEILRGRVLKVIDSTKDGRRKKQLLAWEKRLTGVEALLHNIQQTGARMDIFRDPAQLLERFLTISKESINGGADYGPTDQQKEVYSLLSGRLADTKAKYEAALKKYPAPRRGGELPKEKLDIRSNKN